ncbi:hypothetical protein bAD24_p01465 (plasmid) [Burkholderia sp. AD24]|nr:hypothetical protein bAD24_p01465 [Burkholderia sp. AD24]
MPKMARSKQACQSSGPEIFDPFSQIGVRLERIVQARHRLGRIGIHPYQSR